jgi:hypothetical protein
VHSLHTRTSFHQAGQSRFLIQRPRHPFRLPAKGYRNQFLAIHLEHIKLGGSLAGFDNTLLEAQANQSRSAIPKGHLPRVAPLHETSAPIGSFCGSWCKWSALLPHFSTRSASESAFLPPCRLPPGGPAHAGRSQTKSSFFSLRLIGAAHLQHMRPSIWCRTPAHACQRKVAQGILLQQGPDQIICAILSSGTAARRTNGQFADLWQLQLGYQHRNSI